MCRQCGHSELVAFSCKRRGFCPACLGRRMADTAVHLEERVLPRVPIRHWICSLPWGLRALLGYDRRLCSEVVSAFVEELCRSLRWRAKEALGLASVAEAVTGAVAAVQRTDSALRLNVQFHVLALDGVYVRDAEHGALVFHALPPLTRADVADVAQATASRIEKLLRAQGRSLDRASADPTPPELELDEPGLAACYSAAAEGVGLTGDRAGRPTLRLLVAHDPPPASAADHPDRAVAEVRGVNVHAVQVVDGRDRAAVERLARYVTRPPFAQDRMVRLPDGRVELTLKSVWKDGTRTLVFEPEELIARLVASVPPPRWHLLRYFGVLSSHSRLRSAVVPKPPEDPSRYRAPPALGDQLELPLSPPEKADAEHREPPRRRWAWLLRHVFLADLETCVRCGGPMRWLEAGTSPDIVQRLLREHGLLGREPPTSPAPHRPRGPPGQLALRFSR